MGHSLLAIAWHCLYSVGLSLLALLVLGGALPPGDCLALLVLGGALPPGNCLALLVLGGALPPGDCLALLVRHKLAHLAGTDVVDSVEMPEEVLDTLLLVESCQAIKS